MNVLAYYTDRMGRSSHEERGLKFGALTTAAGAAVAPRMRSVD